MPRKNKGPVPIMYFTCPHCSHSFRLRTRGHKPKCTKCLQRFPGKDNIASQDAKSEVLRRRRESNKKYSVKKNPVLVIDQGPQVVRGDQVPSIKAEAKFKARAMQKGYVVHRPSWPDYLLEKDGKLMHVEVKGHNDEVSKEQALTFNLMERHGIPVYIWKDCDETRGDLIRWGDGIEARRIACKDKSTRINALRRQRDANERLKKSK